MDESMGRLVYLPAGTSGPDPDAFPRRRVDRLAPCTAGAGPFQQHSRPPLSRYTFCREHSAAQRRLVPGVQSRSAAAVKGAHGVTSTPV